jgi:hypothetical protein
MCRPFPFAVSAKLASKFTHAPASSELDFIFDACGSHFLFFVLNVGITTHRQGQRIYEFSALGCSTVLEDLVLQWDSAGSHLDLPLS